MRYLARVNEEDSACRRIAAMYVRQGTPERQRLFEMRKFVELASTVSVETACPH
jgi:hypothetical protein